MSVSKGNEGTLVFTGIILYNETIKVGYRRYWH
jgi:hypothetical protein